MKKILIMGGAVIATFIVQAASISWTIADIYSPNDSTAKITTGTGLAFLFVTDNTSDVALTTTTKAAVMNILNSGNLSGLESIAAVKKSNTADGIVGGSTGLTGFSSGSVTAFALVLDNSDITKAEHYFFAGDGAEKTVSFTSATGAKFMAWGSQATLTQGDGWKPVNIPEPSSALMMMLGMAGLALRRKQKQC